MLTLTIASVLAFSPPVSEQPRPDDIIVDGRRLTPEELRRERDAEGPYSTTPRVMLGTRIARTPERRTFNTVSTDTGLAGLISGPDNNMDAAGGAVRSRLVRICRADREEVSEATACALSEANEMIRAGDFDRAGTILGELLAARHLSSFDRYYAGHYAVLLGQEAEDPVHRRAGLAAMLQSGRMAEADRPAAMRSLVSLALAAGDDAAAIAQLETLVNAVPHDAQSQANLAILYDRQGRVDQARQRMTLAVNQLRTEGRPPPEAWVAYLEIP